MPKEARLAFNRGLISRHGIARKDVERVALSAETMTNWMPRVLGSMSLRAGMGFQGQVLNTGEQGLKTRFIPFVFSNTDKALIEISPSMGLRFWVDGTPIVRPSVAWTISNGNFSSLTDWVDADEAGATSDSAVVDTDTCLRLVGSGYNRAIRYQAITTPNASEEHGVQIRVVRGPVGFRIGSSIGGDDIQKLTFLGKGYHSIGFTPGVSTFYIQFESSRKRIIAVDHISVEAAGDVRVPIPDPTFNMFLSQHLDTVRWAQSADVVYLAHSDGGGTGASYSRPTKIERRGQKSWSWVWYEPEDGPFRVENLSAIRIGSSSLSGNVTLTASSSLFDSRHIGSLFSLDSIGQTAAQSLTGANQFTGHVRVTGVDAARQFSVLLSGTWSGTITLQRSVGEPGTWVDVVTYTGNTTTTYDDNYDNQTMYYRIGFKTGQYTSGTANAIIQFSGGSITGVVRITDVASSTSASAEVLVELGNTEATEIWAEGIWSSLRGFPTSVALFEGRLWWAGKNWITASISDAYESFDQNYEGDAGPIVRTIGEGPVDIINWMLPLQRLIIGLPNGEWTAKSTTFDEPLTATAFSVKKITSQGSAAVAPVDIDSNGFFVQRSQQRVHQLVFDNAQNIYSTADLTSIVPELGRPSVTRLCVQRQPDTRVHCVRSDGKVAVLIYDRTEDVKGWVLVETQGKVVEVVSLPGVEEDEVYYVVNRGTDTVPLVYLEKWALVSECEGGQLNKQLDCFDAFTVAPADTVFTCRGKTDQTVHVWADGRYIGTKTLVGDTLTLDTPAFNVVAGYAYEATFKSSKLGDDFTRRIRIHGINLLLDNTYASGLQYGSDLDHLDELPLVEDGKLSDPATIWEQYHKDSVVVNGTFDQDSRLCLRATAPKPATVLAAIVEYE